MNQDEKSKSPQNPDPDETWKLHSRPNRIKAIKLRKIVAITIRNDITKLHLPVGSPRSKELDRFQLSISTILRQRSTFAIKDGPN